MHRGHQALIARTREWADKLGVPLAVMCFEPTPREYFTRSEEHTSELQSLMRISYAVFCLKKKNRYNHNTTQHNTSTNVKLHSSYNYRKQTPNKHNNTTII